MIDREPTEEMIKLGHAAGIRKDAIWQHFTHEQALIIQTIFLPEAWKVMYDVAFEEYRRSSITDRHHN